MEEDLRVERSELKTFHSKKKKGGGLLFLKAKDWRTYETSFLTNYICMHKQCLYIKSIRDTRTPNLSVTETSEISRIKDGRLILAQNNCLKTLITVYNFSFNCLLCTERRFKWVKERTIFRIHLLYELFLGNKNILRRIS